MPLALTGSLTAVQLCCPAELSLAYDKIEHFETGSFGWDFVKYRYPAVAGCVKQTDRVDKLSIFN
jgi:hypothetical protein